MKRMDENSEPIGVWTIEQMLLDNQKRGLDATGVAVQYADGKIEVVKGSEPAWRFIRSAEWKRFVDKHAEDRETQFKDDVRTVLGHCRAASVGGAWKNENNHPVFAGNVAVTHNGGIRNHEHLFNSLKLPRKAEVDSDIIRAILDDKGLNARGIELLCRMTGPAAIAAVSQKEPGRLLLARSGSPLVVGVLDDPGLLLWSSRKESIHRVARSWRTRWGLFLQKARPDLLIAPFGLETAWVIDEGQEEPAVTGKFNSNSGSLHELTYRCHDTYPSKRREVVEKKGEMAAKAAVESGAANKDGPSASDLQVSVEGDRIPCRNKACSGLLEVTKADADLPLWKLRCPACKTLLGEVGSA